MKKFKTVRNLVVIASVLVGTGYLRMDYERGFTEDLRERKIAHPKIENEIWGEMGQTSLAGAFGGLRSVMALFVSVGAYDHFENNEWYDLKKDYEIVTALDPYNPYYWNHGGWHLGWNAASWARRNPDYSPNRRQIMEMAYLEEGDAFYRKGLKYNPESRELWYEMGAMWAHEFKRPDLERAAEAFSMTRYSANPVYRRRYLFTIARIPGREVEAYDEMIRLMSESKTHFKAAKFRALAVILGSNPELPEGVLRPQIHQVFQTKELAYLDLYNYYARIDYDGLYPGQIERYLKELIQELDIPDEINPFVNKPTQPLFPHVWRQAVENRDKARENSNR